MSFQRMYRRLRFGPPVVVVSGLPRSGTSMTMRMLVAGGMPVVTDGRRAADEDNPTGYFEEEKVKDLALDPDKGWLRRARGKAVKVVSSLLPHLPDSNNYKVLFMHRDLHEVLASQSKMLEHRGETSDTGDDRMLELFRGHLVAVQAMLRTRPCFEVREIEYAAVVRDARGQAERIRSFLGLRLDVGAMAGAVEPELYRNRR
jgi:sulfotransferase family protein